MTPIVTLDGVRALLTLTLSLAFVALWIWAWRKERRADFDAAALLPLQDEHATPQRSDRT